MAVNEHTHTQADTYVVMMPVQRALTHELDLNWSPSRINTSGVWSLLLLFKIAAHK